MAIPAAIAPAEWSDIDVVDVIATLDPLKPIHSYSAITIRTYWISPSAISIDQA